MSIEIKVEEFRRTMLDIIAALDRNTEALTRSTFANHADELQSKYVTGVSIPESLAEKVNGPIEPEKVDSKPSSATVYPVNAEIKRIEERSQEKPVLKYEDMVTAFRQFIGKHGRDKAAEVLTSFGITGKLTQDQLPEDKYQAFLDKLK